jgi:PqqD family protein of HPr-rel-A system
VDAREMDGPGGPARSDSGGDVVRPRRRLDLVVEPLDDEIVVHQPGSGEAHVLNPTAAFVWEQCDGAHADAEIAALLVGRYGVDDERALSDVRACLDRLAGLGLLAADDAAQRA